MIRLKELSERNHLVHVDFVDQYGLDFVPLQVKDGLNNTFGTSSAEAPTFFPERPDQLCCLSTIDLSLHALLTMSPVKSAAAKMYLCLTLESVKWSTPPGGTSCVTVRTCRSGAVGTAQESWRNREHLRCAAYR